MLLLAERSLVQAIRTAGLGSAVLFRRERLLVIRAIYFDLWGTLIYDDPVIGEQRRIRRVDMAHAALADCGLMYDRADIEAGFIVAGMALEQIHAGEVDVSARARTALFLGHIDESLPDRLDDHAWRRLDAAILTPALEHRPVIMPHAEETLLALRAKGLPIGLVSNAGATPGVVLREILDDFGLLRHLDSTVFSDEVEISKPSPAIFEKALEAFDVAPYEAVFVGDEPVLDVFGSRRAGMWCVQIGDKPATQAEPHARIAALRELVPKLQELGLAV